MWYFCVARGRTEHLFHLAWKSSDRLAVAAFDAAGRCTAFFHRAFLEKPPRRASTFSPPRSYSSHRFPDRPTDRARRFCIRARHFWKREREKRTSDCLCGTADGWIGLARSAAAACFVIANPFLRFPSLHRRERMEWTMEWRINEVRNPFPGCELRTRFFVGLACLRKSWTWAKCRVKRQIKSKAAHYSKIIEGCDEELNCSVFSVARFISSFSCSYLSSLSKFHFLEHNEQGPTDLSLRPADRPRESVSEHASARRLHFRIFRA